MNGIHDMGGMHGFGRVEVEANEPAFHEAWHGRTLAIARLVLGNGLANGDAFRYAIESLAPATYLTAGYYGRWVAALERLLVDAGVLAPGELEARMRGTTPSEAHASPAMASGRGGAGGGTAAQSGVGPRGQAGGGFVRAVRRQPRFAIGQAVRARNIHPAGHTRLPRYVRGKQGVVDRIHPACVFPDTNAHGRGENPQHVYSVRFEARELWGEDAEPGARLNLDLFEEYLEAI
jgi:nitrile hydratase beta subunit